MNDTDVWRRIRDGSADAFAELYERYADDIYNFGLRRTHNRSSAEDLVSKVFLEAWRQRQTVIPHEGSLRPWLYGVAHNHLRDRWRARGRFDDAVRRAASSMETDTDHAADVVDRLDSQERLLQVVTAVEALPPAQREVLLLAAWEQLSYEEISVALQIPVGTVRSRLNRARTALDTSKTKAIPSGEETRRPCLTVDIGPTQGGLHDQ